ncbi:MAG: type II toxin-antitoxin system YafQ family toxin [Candidatus Kaiserbacteria bacterium]|nr:type II toxin-antitoxin system YafQ family toxin [Candidatus Kaiserbacteria bacterium]
MNQLFGSSFKKKTDKLPKKIRLALAERLRLFAYNPFDPALNNHKLHGERRHQRSINITGDWRLIFEQYDENTVRLIDIDTHPNLYGS